MHVVNMFRTNVTYLPISSPETQILSELILTHVGWVLGICPFLRYVSNFVLVGTNG